MDSKTCTKCGETKPLEDYHRDKKRKDGRVSDCKSCACAKTRRWNSENRDRKREADANYRANNAERIVESRADYYRRNRDYVRSRVAEYVRANSEVVAARAAEYRARPEVKARRAEYKARPEVKTRIAEYSAEYRAANPHIGWESGYRRRAEKYGHPVDIESFTKDELIARWGDACWHCGGPFEELDHWPLSVRDGGRHSLESCRPSCGTCNRQSWSKSFTA